MRDTAAGRTWAFMELDRTQTYRLWFDPRMRRWEVRPLGESEGTVVTPSGAHRIHGRRREGRGGAPAAEAERQRGADTLSTSAPTPGG